MTVRGKIKYSSRNLINVLDIERHGDSCSFGKDKVKLFKELINFNNVIKFVKVSLLIIFDL